MGTCIPSHTTGGRVMVIRCGGRERASERAGVIHASFHEGRSVLRTIAPRLPRAQRRLFPSHALTQDAEEGGKGAE